MGGDNYSEKNSSESKEMTRPGVKSLHNTDADGARKNVKDLVTFGDADAFALICKASSAHEGWMKSTKAMDVEGLGVIVQVTTQQKNQDNTYSVAEACCFVPGATVSVERDMQSGAITRTIRKIVEDK